MTLDKFMSIAIGIPFIFLLWSLCGVVLIETYKMIGKKK